MGGPTARRLVKILHELSAIGLTGALVAHMVVLSTASTESLVEYAVLRRAIEAITGWLLVPSLALVLISGLSSMIVHTPFQNAGWVWLKALLGFPLFEGTLITIDGLAQTAASLATEAAGGGDHDPALVANMVAAEWRSLWIILVLAVAQTVIGVWRPRLRIGR
ncbi:MAG: hypothetical protein R3F21_07540 [Myxococcota bacterium]